MKNVKSMEMSLIKSRALTVLFSMLISALLLLPLFSSAAGSGKSAKNAKMYIHPMSNEYHAAVTIASVAEGKFNLTIESVDGDDVYYDKVMKSPENFSKVFDFSNLNDGEYTLRMSSKSETKELRFDIVDGKVKVFRNEKVDAAFNLEGEKAIFTVPNASNLNYTILIVDEKGNELYSAIENSAKIKKVFDFSTVEAGKYQILASANGNTYTYDFEKKK